jgi:APA family basic amino acid/polyamine antiporter
MGEDFGLKRVLGLGDLVAIEIGTTVGAGIFSLTALSASLTGPSTPLAFVAAAVPIVFVMMTVGMLGSVMPTVGGSYRYPSRLFSPMWATVGVWSYALALIIGALPLYATQCVTYLQALWPGNPVAAPGSTGLFWPTAGAVGLLTFFYVVNVFGIEMAANVQALLVVVKLVALLIFAVWGFPHLQAARFTPLFPGGAAKFILAACILTFALQGSNAVIELGAEIKRPSRNIPLSLLVSIPVVTVLYVLIAVSALGAVDLGWWTSFGAKASLVQPAKSFLPPGLFYFFILGGAFMAFSTTLNGTFMWATKSPLVLSADGIIPQALAKTGRYGTPFAFLTIIWAGSSGAVILEAIIRHFYTDIKIKPFEIFASYATIGGLIIFIPVMAAAIVMPRRLPELYQRADFKLRGVLLYAAPIIGMVSSAMLVAILCADLKWWALPFPIWVALGFGFYWWRGNKIKQETGSTLKELMEKDLKDMVDATLKGHESPKN